MKKYLSPIYALPFTALLLSLALIVSIVSHMSAIRSGQEVLVPTRGYDPRAILLGHYVSLRPDTKSQITGDLAEKIKAEIQTEDNYSGFEMMWVTLDETSSDWKIADVSRARPETGQPAMHVRTSIYETGDEDTLTYSVTPDINIDRFYANQKQALEIEDKLRDGKDVLLIVSIGQDGTPRLKGLQVEGEREIMSWW